MNERDINPDDASELDSDGLQIDGTANPEIGHRLKRRPVTRPAAFVKRTEEFDPSSTGTEAGETM
jgi:hypothetical protein